MPKRKRIEEKVKRLIAVLFLRSRGRPGVRGYELRKLLGEEYLEVVKAAQKKLEALGLEVRAVTDEGKLLDLENPGSEISEARFVIVVKENLKPEELKSCGWRIDEIAVLATAIVYILSLRGKAPRESIVQLLRDKVPEWRINMALDRFIKIGYLEEEDDLLKLGWRTYAEVDLEKLMTIFSTSTQ